VLAVAQPVLYGCCLQSEVVEPPASLHRRLPVRLRVTLHRQDVELGIGPDTTQPQPTSSTRRPAVRPSLRARQHLVFLPGLSVGMKGFAVASARGTMVGVGFLDCNLAVTVSEGPERPIRWGPAPPATVLASQLLRQGEWRHNPPPG
jgi:hypothetical protein